MLFCGQPAAVRNHRRSYNVLFGDGVVRTHTDEEGNIGRACASAGAEDTERVVDKVVFGEYFDALALQD